jgi:hypothetical protein
MKLVPSALRGLRSYCRFIREQARADTTWSSLSHSACCFSRWRRSLGRNALLDAAPWITFRARDYLDEYLDSTKRVFEFGSGGSTLYFSARAGEITSVDHDSRWSRAVSVLLTQNRLQNCRLLVVPPAPVSNTAGTDPSDPEHYVSGDDAHSGLHFGRYASTIDDYPPNHFDVVMIDGRARPSCFMHAREKVKPGGLLILDNSERAHYRRMFEALDHDEWQCLRFFGPGPYNRYIWETTIWKRGSARGASGESRSAGSSQ